jgi:hypothetical protein
MTSDTYIRLMLYPWRGSRGISDILPRRPRFTIITELWRILTTNITSDIFYIIENLQLKKLFLSFVPYFLIRSQHRKNKEYINANAPVDKESCKGCAGVKSLFFLERARCCFAHRTLESPSSFPWCSCAGLTDLFDIELWWKW